MADVEMEDPPEMLVTRRPKRSTAGNRYAQRFIHFWVTSIDICDSEWKRLSLKWPWMIQKMSRMTMTSSTTRVQSFRLAVLVIVF